MGEKPIIFSAPMVKALLARRKTQTRRIMKPQPDHLQIHTHGGRTIYDGEHRMWCWKDLVLENIWDFPEGEDRKELATRSPYGQPGDKLWVRETYQVEPSGFGPTRVYYPADDSDMNVSLHHDRALMGQAERLWTEPDVNRPSIHMPRWACRLTLEVTDVRVQRLQEIGEEDALAEGVREPSLGEIVWSGIGGMDRNACPPKIAFACLWDEIHGHRAFEDNPWVWAVSFRPTPSEATP